LFDTRYAFISAYLKGEEAKIITSRHVSGMSKMSSIQDVLEIIKETDVGNYLEGVLVKDFADLDKNLWKYFSDCLQRVEWFKPVPSNITRMLKAYIVKYDVINIKAALQTLSSSKKTNAIPIGIIYTGGLLEKLSYAESIADIIKTLIECKLENYASILEEYNTNGRVKSRLLAEAKLDGEYYRNLLNMTKSITDGAVLAKAFGIIIDMTNLQIILRAIVDGTGSEIAEYTLGGGYMISEVVVKDLISLKLSDIPGRLEHTQYHNVVGKIVSSYDRTRSAAVIDEVVEKHKFRLSKEILSPRVVSPLVMAWYLILKEIEIRNLRLISKAVLNNIPVEDLKDYLVLAS
jgi:vacuolar-type H+-ATPase subunit C/Vma6